MKKLVYRSYNENLARKNQTSLKQKGYRTQFAIRRLKDSSDPNDIFWVTQYLVYALSKNHREKEVCLLFAKPRKIRTSGK